MLKVQDMNVIEYKKHYKEYVKNLNKFILTSRFTNKTWSENIEYKNKKNHQGCLYSAPDPVSCQIKPDAIMFVLEMNNDENKIIGIGMIRNKPTVNTHSVYEENIYNRYVFLGEHRIDRTKMNEKEEIVMKAFDTLCFKGNKHMKRGQGLKRFPLDMLFKCKEKLDLVEFISNMFKKRM